MQQNVFMVKLRAVEGFHKPEKPRWSAVDMEMQPRKQD